MPEIPTLVDVEALTLAHLAVDADLGPLVGGPGAGARVAAELPATFPTGGESFVQAFRVSSVDRGSGHLEGALLQFNCYGATRADAWDVTAALVRALGRAPAATHELGVVTAVERVSGPTWSPDPRTDVPRYTLSARLTVHPTPA